MTREDGFTLLEVLVALMIVGLVGLTLLGLFGGTLRSAESSRTWSHGLVYATERMEALKLSREPPQPSSPERLAGGYRRWVEVRPWRGEVVHVTVVVSLPGGGSLTLDRLTSLREPRAGIVAPENAPPENDFQ